MRFSRSNPEICKKAENGEKRTHAQVTFVLWPTGVPALQSDRITKRTLMDEQELKANREFADRIKKAHFPNAPEPPMVDMRNVKVGQIVHAWTDWEDAGPGASGTVVKITPEGLVYVQCGAPRKDGSGNPDELLCFDANGRGTPETNANGPWFVYEIVDDPARYVEDRERQRAAHTKAMAELRRKYEERKKDWKALYERAAQAAQGEGSTKITTLGDFLTGEEYELAGRMWKESEHDYASRIAKRIIEPNIARINAELGQENSPMYLAYVAEYIMKTARCTLPNEDVQAPNPNPNPLIKAWESQSRFVVGQEVRVKSSTYFEFGRVVEVKPEGVVVQAPGKGLLLFDNEGKHCRDKFECLPLLDIKTLVVGQEVWLRSGVYSYKGRVSGGTSARESARGYRPRGWHRGVVMAADTLRQ